MAFAELEDRIDKVEVLLFPETWKRYGTLVNKGSLLLVRAKLQQQDEGVKLLADHLYELDPSFHAAQLAGWRRGPSGRRKGGSAAPQPGAQPRPRPAYPPQGSRSGGAPVPVRPPESRGSGGPDPQAPRPARATAVQRLFVKIDEHHERAGILTSLQALLKDHAGPLQTVLFYEQGQKTIALSEQYTIKPSPELIRLIEGLLGPGTAKVK